MINKQLKEIKENLEIIEKLMQDNTYLKKLDEGLEYQNKKIERLEREKEILEKSLRLILNKNIGKIDYNLLDKANKDIENSLDILKGDDK